MTPTRTLVRPALATAVAVLVLGLLPVAPARSADVTSLSNEQTLSRWAYPVKIRAIFASPSTSSRSVGKLRLLTEDRLPELYLLLNQTTDSTGGEWVQIRVPKRPNGQIGWVQREALGDFHV